MPTRAVGVDIGYFRSQPPQAELPADADKNMIVRNKVTRRPANEKLEPNPVLMADYHGL